VFKDRGLCDGVVHIVRGVGPRTRITLCETQLWREDIVFVSPQTVLTCMPCMRYLWTAELMFAASD
jgi:hypothetical protein